MGKLVLLFFFGVLACSFAHRQMPGGISGDEKDATEEVQGFTEKSSPEIKSKALARLTTGDSNTSSNLFDKETPIALSYKTQVVAGTNYFIKTRIGKYIFHVRMYRDLQRNISITDVIGPKKETDPIMYF